MYTSPLSDDRSLFEISRRGHYRDYFLVCMTKTGFLGHRSKKTKQNSSPKKVNFKNFFLETKEIGKFAEHFVSFRKNMQNIRKINNFRPVLEKIKPPPIFLQIHYSIHKKFWKGMDFFIKVLIDHTYCHPTLKRNSR